MGNKNSNSSSSSTSRSSSHSTSHSASHSSATNGNRRQTVPVECTICHLNVPSNELLDHKLAHELEREEGTDDIIFNNITHNLPPNNPVQTFAFPMTSNALYAMGGSNINNGPVAFQFFPLSASTPNNNNNNNGNNVDENMRMINSFLQSLLQTHIVTHHPHGGNQGISRADFERLSPFAYHIPASLSTSSSSIGDDNNNGEMKNGMEKEKFRETDDPCAVCLMQLNEGEEIVLTPCFHKFHTDCLWSWAKDHGTCPVCKRELRTT